MLDAALHRIKSTPPVRSTIIPTVDNSLLGALTVRLGVKGAKALSVRKRAVGNIHAVRAGPDVVVARETGSWIERGHVIGAAAVGVVVDLEGSCGSSSDERGEDPGKMHLGRG
jgi:hypothetical protein